MRTKEVDIGKIEPKPKKVRESVDHHFVGTLAKSIENYGLLQPIVVAPDGDFYKIIAGEHRWRAYKMLDKERIPCIVREGEEYSTLLLSLVENLQREDLNPIEEANAFYEIFSEVLEGPKDVDSIRKHLRTVYENPKGHEEISAIMESFWYSPRTIQDRLKLLKLHEDIQDSIAKGKTTIHVGRVLSKLNSKKTQKEIFKEAKEKDLSPKQVDNLVKKKLGKYKKPRGGRGGPSPEKMAIKNVIKYLDKLSENLPQSSRWINKAGLEEKKNILRRLKELKSQFDIIINRLDEEIAEKKELPKEFKEKFEDIIVPFIKHQLRSDDKRFSVGEFRRVIPAERKEIVDVLTSKSFTKKFEDATGQKISTQKVTMEKKTFIEVRERSGKSWREKKNRRKILRVLEDNEEGLPVLEICSLAELSRHTVNKYLKRLQLEGKAEMKERGSEKVWKRI